MGDDSRISPRNNGKLVDKDLLDDHHSIFNDNAAAGDGDENGNHIEINAETTDTLPNHSTANAAATTATTTADDNNNNNNNGEQNNNNNNSNSSLRRRRFHSHDEETIRDLFYLNNRFLTDEFRNKCGEVAYDIVTYVCHSGPYHPCPPPSKTTKLMRNLVDDLAKNRGDLMNDMASKIVLNARSVDQLETLLNELASEMFNDDVITWNRIVMFHAFCSYVARHCKYQESLQNSEEIVVKILTDIVVNRLGLWIATCGGWNQFDNQFPLLCCIFQSGSMWKIILLVCAFIGTIIIFYKLIHYLDSSGRI